MIDNYINDHRPRLENQFQTRREFLNRFGTGFGALGLASMLYPELTHGQQAQGALLAAKQPPLAAKAKRVLHIFFQGAQTHLDTWDPKPELKAKAGIGTGDGKGGMGRELLAPQFEFPNYGRSGLQFSNVWSKLAPHADDMTIIRSMHTDVPAHDEATLMMNTGSFQMPKPSLGSWVTYGLGTENQNLPAFVSLAPGGMPNAKNWSNSFMPGAYQGAFVNSQNTKIEEIIANIKSQFTSQSDQRKQLDLLFQLNEIHKQKRQAEAALEARILSFELAYRMQTDATEAFDIAKETEDTRTAYGNSAQGRQMLIARRLLERGVRFVQVWQGGWDTHNGIPQTVSRLGNEIGTGWAALMTDLKQRGLFKDTLIVATTEFGRSPTRDGATGRNHNNKAFSTVLAGGAVKGGTAYGATDELGGSAVENKVHVRDLHATILHALGFDPAKMTYKNGARDARLIGNTDNENEWGKPVMGVMA